jgi:hypothetical protein
MKKETKSTMWSFIKVFFLLFCAIYALYWAGKITYFIGYYVGCEDVREEAIKHNVGEYYIDKESENKKKFKFIELKNESKD